MSFTRAHFDLTVAMVIVGSMTVAGKLVLVEFPIHLSMGLRFLLASALALAWAVWTEGALVRVSRHTFWLLALQAFCGVYMTNALMLVGLRLTTASAAGIITACTPAAMALLARVFLGERLGKRAVMGIVAAVAGVGLLNLPALSGHGSGLWGNLCMVAVVFAESGFLLIRKSIRQDLSPVAATCWVSLLGLLLFLPQALIEAASFDFSAVSLSGWLVIAYYGGVVSVLAYYFWFRAVVAVSAPTAGVFTAIMPLSAMLLSVLVLGEHSGPEHLVACALVVGAIWCICRGE